MSTPASKSDYMLLFRGTVWDKELSPEQLQKVVSDWAKWFERLTQEGKVLAGHPLTSEGKVVSGKRGRTVADGPFVESKEAVGGYFYLQVADLDEAVEIAKECPGLEYGAVVEVRPVAELCTVRARALETPVRAGNLASATA
ncbi:MAG TPA: YciI family protein [Verrucomicrobiae bacterium]|nr:YciI family protein [Verrucomicrobiae bacterium]